MKEKYVLVIDKGTTNLKAVLFNQRGEEVVSIVKPCGEPFSVKPGYSEQDMDAMWVAACGAIREICADKAAASDIMGVSVTGHGSGIFPIDAQGKPVRMGILSLDTRASEVVEEWKRDGRAGWFREKMQAEVLPCYPVSLLAWLKRYEPKSYQKVDKILFVKDWLKFKLTRIATTDYTDIGPSCLLDVERMDYCMEMLDKMGLPEMKNAMPEIIASYQQAGTVTIEAAEFSGLLPGTPVFSGVHDMMACPFGVGTVAADQAVSVIGTWGMNFMSSKKRMGTFSFPHVLSGYFLTGSLDGNSGSVQDRMLELLCPPELMQRENKSIPYHTADAVCPPVGHELRGTRMSIYQYAAGQAAQAPDSGLIFHPYLFGALYDPAACGGFYGMRDWHTRKDMLKAVYEGIVFGHYANIRAIAGYERFTTLWLMGGGAKSDYMAQLFADVTGLRVKTADAEHVTARGAALAALVGLGVCETYEEACIPVAVRKEFNPVQERHQFYQKKFALYEKVGDAMKDIWKEMEKL